MSCIIYILSLLLESCHSPLLSGAGLNINIDIFIACVRLILIIVKMALYRPFKKINKLYIYLKNSERMH